MTRMKIARLALGLSLTDTASRAGLAKGDLSKWERKLKPLYRKAAERLGRVLGVFPDELTEEIEAAVAERTIRDTRRGQWLRAQRRMQPDVFAMYLGGWAQADELAKDFAGWK